MLEETAFNSFSKPQPCKLTKDLKRSVHFITISIFMCPPIATYMYGQSAGVTMRKSKVSLMNCNVSLTNVTSYFDLLGKCYQED